MKASPILFALLISPLCFSVAMGSANYSVDMAFNSIGFVSLPTAGQIQTITQNVYTTGGGIVYVNNSQNYTAVPVFSLVDAFLPDKLTAGFDARYGAGASAILFLFLLFLLILFLIWKYRNALQRYWRLVLVIMGVVIILAIVILGILSMAAPVK